MKLTVVDAFTSKPFAGNPAAVTVVDTFPEDLRMQHIAREMNLSETAFVVPRDDGDYELRWFTPTTEVDLCGHATLASAHVLGGSAAFRTRSGRLTCELVDGWIEMDFPSVEPIEQSLSVVPSGFEHLRWSGTAGADWLVELTSAREVRELKADQTAIAGLGRRGLIVTAENDADDEVDIVSRFFAPSVGIPEDPATGSAHCALAPYWAPKLGRSTLTGYQASPRGGFVRMRLSGDRVVLGGQTVTISEVDLLV